MMSEVGSSSTHKTVHSGGFLSRTLLPRRLVRTSAVASMLGILALLFFPAYSSHATTLLYIPNQHANTVSVVDGSTYSIIKTISVSQEPYGVGVSPDGKTVFITNLAADSVSVIDTGTNAVTNTIRVGDAPFGVVVSPDGRYAYVANAADDNISVIETSGYGVLRQITVGDDPHGLVIHPDGSKLYVTNYFDSTVSVINTSNYSLIKTIAVGTAPHGIAIHPSGSYVYTANVFGDSLSVISTSSNSVVKTVSTGHYPFFPVMDSSGHYLYVSNYGSSSVTVVDASSNSVVGNISVGAGPHGMSLDYSNSRLYVANELGNSVSVIDTSSRTAITVISVATTPSAFGSFAADPRIPSPTGSNVFTAYTDNVLPQKSGDPSLAKPIGLGPISGVGSVLSLSLGANEFASPVDAYLGLSMPAIDPTSIYVFTSTGIQPIYVGILPWKSSVTDISSAVVPNLDALILPTGTYSFYLVVVPADTPLEKLFDNFYQWTAWFSVVRGSDVADKAIALLGSDLAAAVAILLAYDNGYSLDQIIAAIDAGTLSPLGAISGSFSPASGFKPMGGETLVDRYCGNLDLTKPEDQDLCAEIIGDNLQERMDADELPQVRSLLTAMFVDLGYSREQARNAISNECYEWEYTASIRYNLHCGDSSQPPLWETVQPENPKRNALTETMAAICPILGRNRRLFSDNCTPICTDNDSDGYYIQAGCGAGGAVDCNDGDANIRPGRPESCADGVDNNCDGLIDTMDPGCTPPSPCPDPDYPTPCGSDCFQPGAVCCGGGNACAAGEVCSSGGCCSAGDVPCGAGCMPAGGVCCGDAACAGGSECCGSGCMPAGNVCCAGVGHCPPGCVCDYANRKCICP